MRRSDPGPRAAALLLLTLGLAAAADAALWTQENPTDVFANCNDSATSKIIISAIGTITDVNVINVTHKTPYTGRMTLQLTDPSGSVTVLLKETGDGGTGDGIINVDFDDSAANDFPDFQTDGVCNSNKTYRPHENLSAFNGLQINGEWTLTVTNGDCAGRTDCDCAITNGPACPRLLEHWGLEITYDVPPPCGTVTVANRTISMMETQQACQQLIAGPALTIATDLGAGLFAGETVQLENGVTVETNGKLTVGTCGQNLCSVGSALEASCSPCVTSICTADPVCCSTSWDSLCVLQVGTVCGLICP